MATAVVTGAGSGIGAATATELREHGWSVQGWDLVPAVGDLAVDVTDHAAVAAAAAASDEPLDLLVNAAGTGGSGPASELPAAVWDRVIGTNLSGTFHVSQAMHPRLSAAGGSLVVNLASVTGHRAGRGRAAYSTSKAGVLMLTEVLGLEWAQDGIRVVALSPSYVRTPMVERALRSGGLDEERIRRRTPQGRLLDPAEVAGVVRALTSDTFAAVTGSEIRVDGGWTANGDY